MAAALPQDGRRGAARRALSREKPAGEATKKRREAHPLIVIANSPKKDEALAGLERWKARHPEVAKLLAVDDVLVDSMRAAPPRGPHPRKPPPRPRRPAPPQERRTQTTNRQESGRTVLNPERELGDTLVRHSHARDPADARRGGIPSRPAPDHRQPTGLTAHIDDDYFGYSFQRAANVSSVLHPSPPKKRARTTRIAGPTPSARTPQLTASPLYAGTWALGPWLELCPEYARTAREFFESAAADREDGYTEWDIGDMLPPLRCDRRRRHRTRA